MRERPLLFNCDGEVLLGILSQAQQPADCGVLIIVGGPQYRAGSHRQFVLLARQLATAGYSNLRFDYRGMGDSSGAMQDFRTVGADIDTAVQALRQAVPQLRRIVLLGLCDAASAALMHGTHLPFVSGLVLLNPWVRSETSLAQAQIKHYYSARIGDSRFWRKLLRGDVDCGAALREFLQRARTAWTSQAAPSNDSAVFQDAMAAGLRHFDGDVLLVLSGNDLTAQEFRAYTAADPGWLELLSTPRITCLDMPGVDHTFSRAVWRGQLADALLAWLASHRAPTRTPELEQVA